MGFDCGFLLLDLAKEAFRNLEASSSRPEASETSRSIALEISSSVMDSTAVLSSIKNPFRLLGGVPREGLSPNNQTRGASQPSLIVWRRNYTMGVFIQRLLVSLVKMVLPLIPRDENIYFGIFYSVIFTFTYA